MSFLKLEKSAGEFWAVAIADYINSTQEPAYTWSWAGTYLLVVEKLGRQRITPTTGRFPIPSGLAGKLNARCALMLYNHSSHYMNPLRGAYLEALSCYVPLKRTVINWR